MIVKKCKGQLKSDILRRVFKPTGSQYRAVIYLSVFLIKAFHSQINTVQYTTLVFLYVPLLAVNTISY